MTRIKLVISLITFMFIGVSSFVLRWMQNNIYISIELLNKP